MTGKLSGSQYLAIESLKRSHSKLHQVIIRSDATDYSILKADVATIIAELSNAIARL